MSLDAMKLALAALEFDGFTPDDATHRYYTTKAITALRAAIEQAQEPVAWRWKERINSDFDSWVITSSEPPPYAVEKQPLYTAPRRWQRLTDEEIERACVPLGAAMLSFTEVARAIEARLKEKNT